MLFRSLFHPCTANKAASNQILVPWQYFTLPVGETGNEIKPRPYRHGLICDQRLIAIADRKPRIVGLVGSLFTEIKRKKSNAREFGATLHANELGGWVTTRTLVAIVKFSFICGVLNKLSYLFAWRWRISFLAAVLSGNACTQHLWQPCVPSRISYFG